MTGKLKRLRKRVKNKKADIILSLILFSQLQNMDCGIHCCHLLDPRLITEK